MWESRGEAVYQVLRRVRPLILASARVVAERVQPHGLSVGTRAVLELLEESGPATVPELAARLDLTRQAVQRHVDDLVARGHAEPRPNPAHRRSVLIHPTDAGQRTMRTVRARELDDLAEMGTDCSLDDLATAVRVLDSLTHDVRARTTHRRASGEDA